MIFCIWCGQEHDSFLLHRCPNGDDFATRSLKALRGEKAPYPDIKSVFKRRKGDDKDGVDVPLTAEDIDMLIALKIKW